MQEIKTNDGYMLNAVIFGLLIGALMVGVVKYIQGNYSGGWVVFIIASTLLSGIANTWGYSRHRANLKRRLESVKAPGQSKREPIDPAA
jgi:hypothetical protein